MSSGGLGMKIRAANAFVTLGVQDNLSKGLSMAERKLKDFGQRTASMATKLAGAALAVAGPGLISAQAFAGFESTMARVRGLTGATKDEFTLLWQEAKRLGAETQYTARDAARGMAFYAQAGFKVTEIHAAMLPTLDLAAAGQLDVAESADILAKIMHGMGVPATDLTYHVDVLTKAMQTANTDLRQLGEAFKYAGAVSKTAGISFEETTAFLQMMSNAGIQADMAGTTLRGALLALTSPSKEAAEQLKALKIDTMDANGNFVSLADVVRQFESAMTGMGSGEKLEILGRIFDNRQASGFAEAVAQGGDALKKMTESLRDSRGAAARVRASQLNTVAGQWELFTSAIETLQITLGEVTGKPLRSLLRGLTEIVSATLRFVEANQWVVTVLGAIGILLVASAAYFLTLSLAAMGAQAAVQLFGFVVAGVRVTIMAAVIATNMLSAAVAFLASPWFLIGAAVVAAGAALAYFLGSLQPAVQDAGNMFSWLYELVKSVVAGMYNAVVAGRIDLAFKIALAGAKLALSEGLIAISAMFGVTIEDLSRMIAELYKQFMEVVTRMNRWRAEASNWLAKAMGKVVGVDVQDGDSAALAAATEWQKAIDGIDTSKLGKNIADALDPEKQTENLMGLIEEAAVAAENAFKDPDTGPALPPRAAGFTPSPDGIIGNGEAQKFASIGGFTASMLSRQLPGAKGKDAQIADNTKKTVIELQKIGATLGGMGGMVFAP
jgi:TP901 family phage tail tape measure protein